MNKSPAPGTNQTTRLACNGDIEPNSHQSPIKRNNSGEAVNPTLSPTEDRRKVMNRLYAANRREKERKEEEILKKAYEKAYSTTQMYKKMVAILYRKLMLTQPQWEKHEIEWYRIYGSTVDGPTKVSVLLPEYDGLLEFIGNNPQNGLYIPENDNPASTSEFPTLKEMAPSDESPDLASTSVPHGKDLQTTSPDVIQGSSTTTFFGESSTSAQDAEAPRETIELKSQTPHGDSHDIKPETEFDQPSAMTDAKPEAFLSGDIPTPPSDESLEASGHHDDFDNIPEEASPDILLTPNPPWSPEICPPDDYTTQGRIRTFSSEDYTETSGGNTSEEGSDEEYISPSNEEDLQMAIEFLREKQIFG